MNSENAQPNNVIMHFKETFKHSPTQAFSQLGRGFRSRLAYIRERARIESFNYILQSRFTPITSEQNSKILFGTCLAGNPTHDHWTGPFEGMLARYLVSERGVEPHFFFINDDAIRHNVYRGFGFDHRHFHVYDEKLNSLELSGVDQEFLEKLDFSNEVSIYNQTAHGIPLGRLAVASTRRALATSRLTHSNEIQELKERFTHGLKLAVLGENVINDLQPDYILTNHSTYIEYGGVIFHLGIRFGIPTSAWQIFDPHRCSVHNFHTDERLNNIFGPSKRAWEALKLRQGQDQLLSKAQSYLDRRVEGHIDFLPRQPMIGTSNQSELPKNADFDTDLPTVAVFTHLPWEVGSFFHDTYVSHRDWLEATVVSAISNTNVNWIFRIHPSEAVKGSVESTHEILKYLIPPDCSHIRIIDSTDPISSYSLVPYLSAAVTIRGTLAIELPCLGIPVVCAGSGVNTLGSFSIAHLTPTAYEDQLASIQKLEKLSLTDIDEAKLIAYGYFIDEPIAIHSVSNLIQFKSFRALSPEKLHGDIGLKQMADIILSKPQSVSSTQIPSNSASNVL